MRLAKLQLMLANDRYSARLDGDLTHIDLLMHLYYCGYYYNESTIVLRCTTFFFKKRVISIVENTMSCLVVVNQYVNVYKRYNSNANQYSNIRKLHASLTSYDVSKLRMLGIAVSRQISKGSITV